MKDVGDQPLKQIATYMGPEPELFEFVFLTVIDLVALPIQSTKFASLLLQP